MPLYTGIGDRGTTALFDGTTVPKDDPRVAVYGDVDELNATVGLARAAGLPDDLDEMGRRRAARPVRHRGASGRPAVPAHLGPA